MRVKRNPNSPRKAARTFVVRLIADDESPDALRGQISEPASDEGWRATFANADEIQGLLRSRFKSSRGLPHLTTTTTEDTNMGTNQEHCCGPEHDKAFFQEVFAVFAKYPDEGRKYCIACLDHETDQMGIDFTQQVGIKKIEGNRVITDFVTREELDTIRAEKGGLDCCLWWNGQCSSWWY